MEKVILLRDVLPEITTYLVLGIFTCLAFLWGEFNFKINHKNQKIDKNLQIKRQQKVISIFFTLFSFWILGFIILLNYFTGANWHYIVPFSILTLGIVVLAYLLRKR